MTITNSVLRPGFHMIANAGQDVVRAGMLGNVGDTLSYGIKARANGKRPVKSAGSTTYYLVSITNKADVLKGVKPIVEDVGPYVFSSYTRHFRLKKDATVSHPTPDQLKIVPAAFTFVVLLSRFECAEKRMLAHDRNLSCHCTKFKLDQLLSPYRKRRCSLRVLPTTFMRRITLVEVRVLRRRRGQTSANAWTGRYVT